jgi:hypothetical protein
MAAAELEHLPELEEEILETVYESSLESDLLLPELEARHVPPGRCTPLGKRVGNFTCSNAEIAAIRAFLALPTVTAPTLRAAVEAAAGRAVPLATRAADALDRSRRTDRTRRIFCEAFGVSPEFVPPWRAGLRGVVRWRDLGELVAIRLKDVAKILDGGCIHYFCWGSPSHCPECSGPPTYFACSSFLGRYIICLGQGFWRAWRAGDTATTASTLLHEALHIYFRRTVSDSGRSGNANCYERFAVRLQNLALHPATAANCRAGSCPDILDRFQFDRPSLQPFHIPVIERIARVVVASWSTTRPIRNIELVGHADSRGSASYNVALGGRRAGAVRDRLAAAIGRLRPSLTRQIRFAVRSMGATRPIAPRTTSEGQARNRRVEVFFRP